MLNYDKLPRIFSCLLLTRNHMIFLVQFGINKHLLIFQRPQIARALRARTILLVFKKIFSCLFILNCTRNHVITHTNRRYDPCSSNYDNVKKVLLLLLISFFLLI